MQTFLPYADFTASSIALDDRRLGKQRVETFQILRALTWPEYAWKNHPAVRMWRGFVPALVAYGLANCAEWVRRGNADTVEASLLTFTKGRRPDERSLARDGQLPPWFGLPALHLSHRSALMRKDPDHYRPLFGEVPDDIPYLWPPDAFPRWPARRPVGAAPGLAAALDALGYAEPRAGQAEAVAAVEAGRDVLGCFAPGAGATSTALLAGLSRPGPTVWISAHAGGGGQLPPGGLTPPPPRIREAVERRGNGEAGDTDGDGTGAGTGTSDPVDGIEESDQSDGTATSRSSSTPAARPPSPVEVLAMDAEADAVPDFRFHRPEDLEDPALRADLTAASPALIVVDLGPLADGAVPAAHADAVHRLRGRADAPPLLVVGPEQDPEARAGLAASFGMPAPVLVGGGFDPARLRLGVLVVPDENRRRTALARLIAHGPKPGLVLAVDESSSRRLAKGLADRGARVAALPPTGRRATNDASVAAWRRGALQALVLPADQPLPAERLGRKDATFVHVAGLPRSPRRLLALLDAVPNRAASPAVVLVVTDDEGQRAAAWSPIWRRFVEGDTCRRAALLDVVGEPVDVPCGRCDVCLGIAANELAAAPPAH